ncbi:MAG: CoA-binding protein [Deltaproteobacteria bacterium]|nr:CoA-binding protein [Deltaproteobacteria bacterium]
MKYNQRLVRQLDNIFAPRSVAIVGLPRGMKIGKLFLTAFQDLGFRGPIYPVHPKAHEIDGLRTYRSVSAVPGPVDLAIILVPHHSALPVVRDCAAKGVKGAVLFTAGYKETGTQEGKTLENKLVQVARSSGMRLFGPNCMGIYAPKTGVSFFPGLSRESGNVGLISHSGSLANILALIGPQKGIRFSKVVSLGNECDLSSVDLLNYLGSDEATGVIGAYLENIKNGPAFLNALKNASKKKPVVLWKLGITPEGGKAAASHTGALSGSPTIWNAVVRQGGAVSVVGLDVLLDTLMGFALLPSNLGNRIAILSGPGGLAVAAAEACGRAGLELAEISEKTRSELSKVIPATGTSLRNPVDVGLTPSIQIDVYDFSAKILAEDPSVDALVVIGRGMTAELNEAFAHAIIKTHEKHKKPFMIVDVPGFDKGLSETFCRSGIPFFQTVERAVSVYAEVRRYQNRSGNMKR